MVCFCFVMLSVSHRLIRFIPIVILHRLSSLTDRFPLTPTTFKWFNSSLLSLPGFCWNPIVAKKQNTRTLDLEEKKRNPWIGFHCLDLFERYETNELTIWKDLFTFLMTCLVFSRDSISPNPGRSAGKHPLIANLLSVNVLAVLKCTKHHFGSRLPLNWTSSRKAGKSGSKVTCCSV